MKTNWDRIRRWLKCLVNPWRARNRRQLRLCESLALGERRFLSVVECGQQKFLVGGTGSSLAVLAVLARTPPEAYSPGEEVPVWEFVNGSLNRKVRCG